jgi:hypothetical protein
MDDGWFDADFFDSDWFDTGPEPYNPPIRVTNQLAMTSDDPTMTSELRSMTSD